MDAKWFNFLDTNSILPHWKSCSLEGHNEFNEFIRLFLSFWQIWYLSRFWSFVFLPNVPKRSFLSSNCAHNAHFSNFNNLAHKKKSVEECEISEITQSQINVRGEKLNIGRSLVMNRYLPILKHLLLLTK